MKPLSAWMLMDAWEAGRDRGPLDRCALLLNAARPELSGEAIDGLRVGERDALLLQLRVAHFGGAAECTVSCPACGEALEFPLDLDAMSRLAPSQAGPFLLEHQGWSLRFRLPRVEDLRALAEAAPQSAQSILLSRCVMAAHQGDEERSVEALPEAICGALLERMSALDPLADIAMEMRCPSCAHAWSTRLDVGAFLWRELETEVQRLARQVHALAVGYHWSEEAILRMSPARRRLYLQQLGAS